jgi:secretion/DNA translocation related TadE-like protein
VTARPGRAATESGSATVIALVLFGVVAVVAVCGAALGGLVVGQRKVSAAADLAALAGATALQTGRAPCPAAGAVAAANGTELEACTQDAEIVTVRVTAALQFPLGTGVRLTARARAGPA